MDQPQQYTYRGDRFTDPFYKGRICTAVRNKGAKETEEAINLITNQIDGWLKQQKRS